MPYRTLTINATTTRWIYDGWNMIAEYTGTTLSKTYTWGMDLSGSMQGAGDVGGLLSVTEHVGAVKTHYYPTFDGNGNVSEYLDALGVVQASYQYDAFGRTVAATGLKKDDFAHRFSTKYLDQETGLYYYGYRYYDPVTGRWPSRDPIEEAGGFNLYGFVGNDGVNRWDFLGMAPSIDENAVEFVWGAISEAASKMASAPLGKESGMLNAVNRLRDPARSVYMYFVEDGNYYMPFFDKLYVERGADTGTILHELVHVFNDKRMFGTPSDRTDEGMAYGFEAMYNVMAGIEDNVASILRKEASTGSDCEAVRIAVARGWRRAWGYGHKDINGQLNDSTSFTISASDFSNIKKHLGAKISCAKIAKKLNGMKTTNKCCIKFSCEKGKARREVINGKETYVVPVLFDIHSSLK